MVQSLRNIMFLGCLVLASAGALPVEQAHAAEWANTAVRYVAGRDEHDDALQAIKRGEIMSYSQIKRAVEGRLGGRVVDIKLRRTNRGWQYFLRVSRKDGRVVAAVVDAKSARILSTR